MHSFISKYACSALIFPDKECVLPNGRHRYLRTHKITNYKQPCIHKETRNNNKQYCLKTSRVYICLNMNVMRTVLFGYKQGLTHTFLATCGKPTRLTDRYIKVVLKMCLWSSLQD